MASAEFEQIVDRYYGNLYRFALSLAKTEEQAADLTQQTFFIWAKKGHQLKDRTKVKSWLFTTLHREFLKYIRRSSRMEVGEVAEYRPEAPTVGHDGEEKSDHAYLLGLIRELDDAYRVPLMMFYTEDFSYKEIAKALDIPIGTVMTRLSRGRNQVRDKLEKRPLSGEGKVVEFREQGRKTGNE
ncbi:MAG: RNA polymerase sigma factor [Verrucomicrobiota bacterium]